MTQALLFVGGVICLLVVLLFLFVFLSPKTKSQAPPVPNRKPLTFTGPTDQFKCDACGHDFLQPLPVIDAQAIARQAHEAVRGSLPWGARITRPAEVLCQTCVGRLVGAPEALRRRGGL